MTVLLVKKLCSGCNIIKPLVCFHKEKRGAFGRRPTCKVCRRKYDGNRYTRNKESIIERSRIWRAKNPTYRSDYYKDNKEQAVLISRLWREKNGERHAENSAKWSKANPDKKLNSRRKRLAKLEGIENTMPDDWWNLLLAFYKAECAKCGTKENLTHDHVIPVTWEGSEHSLRNSQILCASHNSGKRNYNDDDYRDWSKGILSFRYVS